MNTNQKHHWTRAEADEKIQQLHGMKTRELRTLWAELFGDYCYSWNAPFLRRRLEWRINTLVSGGISERARKRAEEIMDDTLLKVRPWRYKERELAHPPLPQQIIRKHYRGELHEVHCCEWGYEYRGMRFASLSAVATHIAGYHVSCTKFFGVRVRGEQEKGELR